MKGNKLFQKEMAVLLEYDIWYSLFHTNISMNITKKLHGGGWTFWILNSNLYSLAQSFPFRICRYCFVLHVIKVTAPHYLRFCRMPGGLDIAKQWIHYSRIKILTLSEAFAKKTTWEGPLFKSELWDKSARMHICFSVTKPFLNS